MFVSIDDAIGKVEKQIRRQAERSRVRNGDAKEVLLMSANHMESEQVDREMMSVAEATNRVEDGEDIVVFTDTDSGATRVVFRRPDGKLKLIDVAG
jgi:hypothetical protein